METVQRHEWEELNKMVSICKHCECERVDYSDDATRYYDGENCDYLEPACIARLLNAPQRNTE